MPEIEKIKPKIFRNCYKRSNKHNDVHNRHSIDMLETYRELFIHYCSDVEFFMLSRKKFNTLS